jgi:hypothetical protein
MLEQTIPSNTVQKRTERSSRRNKSIRVVYELNKHFLRNILRRDPAVAHSEDKPVNVGLPSTIERNESLFIALPHQIHQSLVTEMGSQIHPLLFVVTAFLSYSSGGEGNKFQNFFRSSRSNKKPKISTGHCDEEGDTSIFHAESINLERR